MEGEMEGEMEGGRKKGRRGRKGGREGGERERKKGEKEREEGEGGQGGEGMTGEKIGERRKRERWKISLCSAKTHWDNKQVSDSFVKGLINQIIPNLVVSETVS